MTDIAGNRTLSSQWNETVQFYGNQNFLEYISVDDQLTSYTYSEFHYRVIQTANWFHSLGIRKGELVALHLHNSPEYLMCWLALAQIGAVSVPLNEHYRLQESKFVLQKCDIHRIIVEPSSLPIYQSNKEDLLLSTIILAWGECPDPDILSLSASSFFDGSRLDESCEILPEDTAVILFTSGTTQYPKGAASSRSCRRTRRKRRSILTSFSAIISPEERNISPKTAASIWKWRIFRSVKFNEAAGHAL